jgi:hypothetical protein
MKAAQIPRGVTSYFVLGILERGVLGFAAGNGGRVLLAPADHASIEGSNAVRRRVAREHARM